MKICKVCGEVNQRDTEYCCNCGKNSFLFSEESLCPICGTQNDKNFAHCTNCGSELPIEQKNAVEAVENSENRELEYFEGGSVERSSPKETVKCLKCGTEMQINSIFCYRCGEIVSRLHEHRIVKRKICNSCNTPNLNENPYCSYCYASLAEAVDEDFQLVHEPVQVGKLTAKQAILQGNSGKFKICNNCGALNKQNGDFCIQCGLILILREQKRYCVNCGAENPSDAQFCGKCQWSFDGQAPKTNEIWKCGTCENLNESESQFCTRCGIKK